MCLSKVSFDVKSNPYVYKIFYCVDDKIQDFNTQSKNYELGKLYTSDYQEYLNEYFKYSVGFHGFTSYKDAKNYFNSFGNKLNGHHEKYHIFKCEFSDVLAIGYERVLDVGPLILCIVADKMTIIRQVDGGFINGK